MTNYLDFERPLAEIEGKAEELRALARSNPEMDVGGEAAALYMARADGEFVVTGLPPRINAR
jgi:acetyl-CoA carboxylase carboxyl transferase subunit alpha